MTKKNKYKRNKGLDYFPSLYMILDDYPVNKYGLGSAIKGAFKDSFSADGLKSIAGAGIGSLGSVVGNIGGDLISGGKSSAVGDAIGNIGGTLGSAIGAVDPVAGMVVGAGTKLIGGAINAIGGVKLNKERIALAENEINNVLSFNADASNFDNLLSLINSAPVIEGFSLKDIGSNSLFNKGATKEFNRLKKMQEFAEALRDRSIANNATNLQLNQMNNLLTNYAAYGGLLDNSFGGGAIDYDLANQQLGINAMKAMSLNRQYSLPNMGLNTFAEGGGIHIKPSKRGTFTAAAKKHGKGVQEFASLVLANKENYSPAMVKKANFARNAAKWHAFGGDLITNGGVFSNGVTTISNGGTHEESPYEGVQVGVDPLGIPNLVEEGETIWNDYVFSNRIPIPNAVRSKYKLRGTKDMSFSDAAKKILKASEERPNDPISMETMNINLTRLALEQEALRQRKNLGQEGRKYKDGGEIEDKILSTIPDISKYIRPRDITPNMLPPLNNINNSKINNNSKKNNNTNNNYATWLRYAPVAGSAIGLGLTLLSSPDYSRADALALYAQNTGLITPISYDPLGNYLIYNPTDINYQANRAAALAAATRRDIMNTTGGNRANAVGSLLAADYNALLALGELLRLAEEANFGRRMQVENFNRATNLTNAEMALKAAVANQEAGLKASQLGLSSYTTAMQMKDAIDALRNASISANLTNLFDSLGDIGREEVARRMVMENPALLYDYYGRYKNNESAKGGKLNKKKRGGFTY